MLSAMPKLVTSGATLRCSEGATPSQLTVPPDDKIDADTAPLATVEHHQPVAHIAPFGVCKAVANPQVAASPAGSAPCVPVTDSAWTPGAAHVTLQGKIALTADSTCACKWAGVITIENSGTETEAV